MTKAKRILRMRAKQIPRIIAIQRTVLNIRRPGSFQEGQLSPRKKKMKQN